MLQDKDRIFTNLHGLGDWGLAGAKARDVVNQAKPLATDGTAEHCKVFGKEPC